MHSTAYAVERHGRVEDAGRNGPRAMPPTITLVSRDHVSKVLVNIVSLRENGQTLLAQLRGSLAELRTLRRELRFQGQTLIGGTRRASPQMVSPERTGDAKRERRLGRPSSASSNRRAADALRLTAREWEVADLLAEGLSNSAVASRLGISAHTARHHTQHVLSKLEVRSRSAAGARLRALR